MHRYHICSIRRCSYYYSISPRNLIWLLFTSGHYSRAAFIINPKRNSPLGTTKLEETGPFADIDDDEDELEENELVLELEDC